MLFINSVRFFARVSFFIHCVKISIYAVHYVILYCTWFLIFEKYLLVFGFVARKLFCRKYLKLIFSNFFYQAPEKKNPNCAKGMFQVHEYFLEIDELNKYFHCDENFFKN